MIESERFLSMASVRNFKFDSIDELFSFGSRDLFEKLKKTSLLSRYQKNCLEIFELSQYIENSKKFFDEKFSNFDFSVYSHSELTFFEYINSDKDSRFNFFDDKISVFDLNSSFNKFNFATCVCAFYRKDIEKFSFEGLYLSKICMAPVDVTFSHEIIHALSLTSGCVLDYLDDELLSILIEKIFIFENYDSTVFELNELNRWIDLKKNLKNSRFVANHNLMLIYYKSNLIATYLFNLYKVLSIDDKKNFFKDIQSILDLSYNMHDFMHDYNLSLLNPDVISSGCESLNSSVEISKILKKNKFKIM